VGSAFTATNGTYKVTGLHANSTGYVVCAVPTSFSSSTTAAPATGWAAHCYNDVAWSGAGTPPGTKLPLSAGQNRTGINIGLPVGGEISGTTYDGAGTSNLAADVNVEVFTAGGKFVFGSNSSDSSGAYSVKGLTPGNYTVC